MKVKRKVSPTQIVVLGFFLVILVGAILLKLPLTHNENIDVGFVDALFTSTSAVCVTGLISIDTADHFNVLGRFIVGLLIQVGGLGVTSVGAAFILLANKRLGLSQRVLIKEGLNLSSLNGVVKLVKSVLLMTLCFEGIGMLLSFIVFRQDYSFFDALGISAFHSVASFNNAGFDILGNLQNLMNYRDNVLLNLVTAGLIVFGGLGFVVIKEIINKRRWHKLSMNTKIVISVTLGLIVSGTILLKLSTDISWLGAFFHSVSARTAGFSTYPIGEFTNAALFVLIILMFIGASPGSTGGGIKTTTMFTILSTIKGVATNTPITAFKRRIPSESILKAFVITFLALMTVCVGTFLISLVEVDYSFLQVLFEVVSGFGTVGLSTGITPYLSNISKLILCVIMFIGRLGPLSIACIWSYRMVTSDVNYVEEKITIG
ncbi:MAG TPA: H(+)-transporting ATPase [Firmicutes bacterium]|nr:H(+)-transporting ATPase [Bacillota bacterium]